MSQQNPTMSWNLTPTGQPLNTMASTGTSNPVLGTKIITALVLLATFLYGLVMNNLFLWVLGYRMNKTINTTWFFHLILAHLAFTFVLPFAVVEILFTTYPKFEVVICKLIASLLTVSMYGGIFFLTVISLDRYMSVFAPHWYRTHMNPRYATIICLLLWGLSILFSTPYLVFEPLPKGNSSIVCDSGYTLPSNWGNQGVKWCLYTFRVLVGYILPVLISSFCYVRIAIKMKTGKLARSSKPYKVICVKIVFLSAFLLPYYIMEGMIMAGDYGKGTLNAIWILTALLGCLYACLNPLFYLLSMHSFKAIFKNSMVSLIESVFKEMSQ